MSKALETQQVNYSWVKQVAKEMGVSVNDLIVLAPQNDPFYTGTAGDLAQGKWFAAIWHQIGDERMHIRRVHYWLVSQRSSTLANGKPYENTVECWDILNAASKAARYLRLVDPEAFNDRRTPETVIYARPLREYVPSIGLYGSVHRSDIHLPDFPDLPEFDVEAYKAEQPFHLEVWCEKSTMNDVLTPLCEKYAANLQTGMGEMSITAILSLVRRLEHAGKPARIFYVSDFDPAGQSMPVAMSRKIEYFVRTFGLDLDIRVFPVVLTVEQVQYYQLPRTPIKESERRRGDFEQRHGEGAVELDALEALYPGTLSELLSQYIEHYYDMTLRHRVAEQRRALDTYLGTVWQQVTGHYQGDVADLQNEYNQIRAEFDARMAGYGGRLQSLWQAIKSDLGQYVGVVDDYPVPQADWFGELGEGLYDSRRDYLNQINAYKQFQGRS